MSIICVPIKVEALVCKNVTNAVTTQDDFEELPYKNDEGHDISSDAANLASTITRKAFNNRMDLLPGIHLHWRMPDALTKGVVNTEYGKGDDLTSIDMPTVPNRWMVVRTLVKTGEKRRWVVESDYIHPADKRPDNAVCMPRQLQDKRKQPYCYVGRQLPFDEWKNELDRSDHKYLQNLTVLGWGSPYFSALYTDCFSVFGAHDDELILPNDVKKYRYEVYGWYSDSDNDYALQCVEKASSNFVDDAKSIAKWLVPDLKGEKVNGMICYGQVDFSHSKNIDDTSLDNLGQFNDTEVTLAKTAKEVVSKYLANKCGDDEQSIQAIENQMQSMLYSEDIEGKNIDFINRLKNIRHKEEFRPVGSGVLWSYVDEGRLMEGKACPENAKAKAIDDEMKERAKKHYLLFKKHCQPLLDKLNSLQQELNEVVNNRQYYLRLLYSDWSKYMQCLHPDEALNSAYPDANHIRHMIERDTLPMVEKCNNDIHVLQEKIAGTDDQLGSVGAVNNYLTTLIANDFTEFMIEAGVDGVTIASPLMKIPAPRYWQVQPPSLLIAGDVIKQPDWHEVDKNLTADDVAKQPKHLRGDDILECRLVAEGNSTSPQQWLINDEISTLTGWPKAIRKWDSQPWSPLLMEWRMDIYSDANKNTDRIAGEEFYGENVVSDNYRICLNDAQYGLPSSSVDLMLKNPDKEVMDTPVSITGRTLLAFSNKKEIKEKLDKFASLDVKEEYKKITKAIDTFNNTEVMMQSLDTLHDDMLMYSDATLLKVQDPLGFSSPPGFKDNLTERVAKATKGQNFKLPVIDHAFLPIKSGECSLQKLRIVDSFGRFKDVSCNKKGGADNKPEVFSMPPRVLQPLRLYCRWKNDIDIENNDLSTPVVGWLCYNHFDETLVIYDADGVEQGAMNSDGEWLDPTGSFAGLNDINSRSLKQFVLKIISFHQRNRIVKATLNEVANDSGALWDALVELKILRAFDGGEKAYLQPVSPKDWPASVGDFSIVMGQLEKAMSEGNHFPALKEAILKAQDNIEPDSVRRVVEAGTLKPLAIVKANIDLQTMGQPEVSKSWSALNHDITNNYRINRGFTKVKFPIKVGEYNNLDDGLVAYWRENNDGSLSSRGYFPQSGMEDILDYIDSANFNENDLIAYVDDAVDEGVENILHSIDDEPVTLLMLLDPEACTHITSGTVPRKTLSLEMHWYIDALESIRSYYFAAPMITPVSGLSLPLPQEKTWQWLQRNRFGGLDMSVSRKVVSREKFISGGYEELHWQKLQQAKVLLDVPEWPGHAYFYEVDAAELEEDLEAEWEAIRGHIMAVSERDITTPDSLPPLDVRTKIVEGWLTPLSPPLRK
ncbi:hypothetical protein EDC56_2228 [Sinobacterium caligoides]|uniref:Uncharacterized protein n=1 Tax=Sinobacterium caligoides TaxID=933926 RepID=A0A3N2DPR3_9GAMM|nr:hypothetical protein [Sinobacterium caligoides]ROS01783.1 hypothetical protein EDC56_2228 [Sinobacterium caligoides]